MKRTAQPDAILVKNYQNGDDNAFEALLLRYKSKVYSTIYLIVKDRDEAEDLMQETFIKVIDTIKGGRYNEEGKFAPWLMRIAHNMAIDHFRRNKRYPTIVMDDESAFLETRLVSYQNGENEKIKADYNYEKFKETFEKEMAKFGEGK